MNCINFPTDRKQCALEIKLGINLIGTVANNLLSIKEQMEGRLWCWRCAWYGNGTYRSPGGIFELSIATFKD